MLLVWLLSLCYNLVMFEVRAYSPFDENWEERDDYIIAAAGRQSSFSGATHGSRDHGWLVENFQEALALKDKLNKVPLVNATIREN
jgi:hypothetical protein